MGTRSLTFFYHYQKEQPFCCFYRQFDGYPTGHGQELANLIAPMRLVNGFQMDMKAGEVANGMGCLAAQVITALKSEIGLGGIYMTDTDLDQDSGQEYEYHVHAWQDDSENWANKTPFHTRVVVKDVYADKRVIFDGTFEQFREWAQNPPQTEDHDYIPVIGNVEADATVLSLRDSLRKGVVAVTFRKADNTKRFMRCTLNPDYIPEDRIPGASTSLRRDPKLFKVWDVQKKDWRSFREERVLNWSAE